MPLLSKCKTYEEEDVCKAKISAWLRLLETINERLPSQFVQVCAPLLNYCFGINEQVAADCKLKWDVELTLSSPLTPTHQYPNLTHIGFEIFVSILFNGDLKWLDRDQELRKKFKHVNINREYNIRSVLNEPGAFVMMIKVYFKLFLAKPQSFDSKVLIEIWKRFCDLLSIDYASLEEHQSEEKPVTNEKITAVDIESETRSFMALNFLLNTMEFINSSSFTNNSKQLENKFSIKLVKHSLQVFNGESVQNFLDNEKIRTELLKMIKKAVSVLLVTTSSSSSSSDESSSVSSSDFLYNTHTLLKLSESHLSLVDLDNWLCIANKLNDHLRSMTKKTNIINLTEENVETIQLCLMFPINHIKKFKIFQEADLKLVVSNCTSLSKHFAGLIKQSRVKLDNEDTLNVNQWCSKVFLNLNQLATLNEDNTEPSAANIDIDEATIKLSQIKIQLAHNIIQNLFEFTSIKSNQQDDNEEEKEEDQPISFSSSKKVDSSIKVFSSIIEFIQRETKRFHDLITRNMSGDQEPAQPKNKLVDSSSENSSDSSSMREALVEERHKSSSNEAKQSIQWFCQLIEMLSVLFTRVKEHKVLNEFLIAFAQTIEQTSELNSIGKLNMSASAAAASTDSPASHKHKHTHSRYSVVNSANPTSISFQSNKRSNDLYDTFSMQVASYIQNDLTKTYFTHEFDSILLKKLEPVFFSFLHYSTKLSLKQKTLQAWNSTFGKSTVSSLIYSQRLEKLFIELREEMIRSSNSQTNPSRTNMGLIAISLPGFKPIDLYNQATNTATADDFMLSEEKENTPEQHQNKSEIQVSIGASNNGQANLINKLQVSSKEYIVNDSSNSVPMAQLVMKSEASKNLLQQSQAQNNTDSPSTTPTTTATPASPSLNPNTTTTTTTTTNKNNQSVNFVFSPAGGQNSFLNTLKNVSLSASKMGSLKQHQHLTTPSNEHQRYSPRSLRQNSKRKLDLNSLLDQMPDKDFVEIDEAQKSTVTNLLHKFDPQATKQAKFKKPVLTEHQKEVRKQKSFLPFECQGLEPHSNMDSQMSFTNDCDDSMQSQSMIVYPSQHDQQSNRNFSSRKSMPASISSTDQGMDLDKDDNDDYLLANMDLSVSKETPKLAPKKESPTPSPTPPPAPAPTTTTSSIVFQSKMNPTKQIKIVEVLADNEDNSDNAKNDKNASPASSYESVSSSFGVAGEVVANNVVQAKPDLLPIAQEVKPTEELPSVAQVTAEVKKENVNRRCSARLSNIKSVNLTLTNNSLINTPSNESTQSHIVASSPPTVAVTCGVRRLRNNRKLFNFYMNNKKRKDNTPTINTTPTTTTNANDKPKSLRHNFKNKIKSINKFSTSSGMTFKEKLNHGQKLAKYKRLIRNLKKDNNKNEEIFKNSQTLNEIKEDKFNLPAASIEEPVVEVPLLEKRVEVAQVETKEPENVDLISDDDEDNEPLAVLILKKTENNDSEIITIKEESDLVDEKSSSKIDATPTLSTPIASRVLTRSSLAPNIKLNTPTSILKKRAASKAPEIGISKTTSALINDDTPSKRRVSFSATIQVEEIEPNASKSLFTRVATPKAQNKAKIVLTPHFNKSSNSAAASTTVSSSSDLNSKSSLCQNLTQSLNDDSKDIQQHSTATATTTTTPTTIANANSIKSISLGLSQSASKLLSASANSSATRLSLAEQNCLLLSPVGLLVNNGNAAMSSVVNQTTGGSLSMPSSPSLLTSFFSNKQSFLSQRSTKIQELKTNLSTNSSSSPSSTGSAQKTNESPHKPTQKNIQRSLTNDAVAPAPTTSTTPLHCQYPKLQNSPTSIEALLLNEHLSPFFQKGASKIFQSKNIFTIGHLIQYHSSNKHDLDLLPFKAPKADNFVNFMQNLEKLDESEQSVLSKISSVCNSAAVALSMGSVEEEMEKLESSSNCFDTSIECEKEIEMDVVIPIVIIADTHQQQQQQAQTEDKLARDLLDLLELKRDFNEKTEELFKLKQCIINFKGDGIADQDLRNQKIKYNELSMHLSEILLGNRMRF
jgi:hypothetical protein